MFFQKRSEVDESLNLYYEEEKAKREQELENEILKSELRFCIKCANDRQGYEHEYHQGIENKKSELARLDAEIEFKNRLTRHYETLLEEKDKTILILKDIIAKLLSSKIESTINE